MKKYSLEHEQFLKKIKRRKYLVLLTQLFLCMFIFTIWEILSHFSIINTFLYSSPSRIISTLYHLFLSQNLLPHIGITLLEIFISFFLSVSMSLLISICLLFIPFLSDVLDPYLTILNSLPKVALGPLIIIWCGANTNSIIFMSLLISTFVTIMNIYQGFISVPNHYLILLKSFGANKWQLFKKVIFPYNRSNIISALKVNISMNLIGVIMGELLVSKKGLGYLIMYGSQVFNLDLVISCILLLCIVSYLLYLCINKIK